MYNVRQTKHGPDKREFQKWSEKKCSESTRLSTIQGNGPDKERTLRNELKILGGVKLVVHFLPWDFN